MTHSLEIGTAVHDGTYKFTRKQLHHGTPRCFTLPGTMMRKATLPAVMLPESVHATCGGGEKKVRMGKGLVLINLTKMQSIIEAIEAIARDGSTKT